MSTPPTRRDNGCGTSSLAIQNRLTFSPYWTSDLLQCRPLLTYARQAGLPNPELALSEPEGLLAAGGALTPEWLVEAYALGIFPWFERDEDPIYWWSPAERAVMKPGSMRVTRSLSKRIRNAGFRVSFDCGFELVIEACARSRAASFGTWITPKCSPPTANFITAGSRTVWKSGNRRTSLVGCMVFL